MTEYKTQDEVLIVPQGDEDVVDVVWLYTWMQAARYLLNEARAQVSPELRARIDALLAKERTS